MNLLHFDHLPFIAASYALFLSVALGLAVAARLRLSRAETRLRAVDPRARNRAGTNPE